MTCNTDTRTSRWGYDLGRAEAFNMLSCLGHNAGVSLGKLGEKQPWQGRYSYSYEGSPPTVKTNMSTSDPLRASSRAVFVRITGPPSKARKSYTSRSGPVCKTQDILLRHRNKEKYEVVTNFTNCLLGTFSRDYQKSAPQYPIWSCLSTKLSVGLGLVWPWISL